MATSVARLSPRDRSHRAHTLVDRGSTRCVWCARGGVMKFRALSAAALAAPFCLLVACGGDTKGPPLFQPKPECVGAAVVPYAGSNDQIISTLQIGSSTDGFDLDGDGKPDNKLAAVGSLAASSISDSFKKYQ